MTAKEMLKQVTKTAWLRRRIQPILDKAVREEREACAKVADNEGGLGCRCAEVIADAIRARKEGP